MTSDKNTLNSSVVDNDFYTASLDEKGEWIFKSKAPQLKLDGKYRDVPRYPMIYEYENQFKKDYSNELVSMVTGIGKKLIEIYKQEK